MTGAEFRGLLLEKWGKSFDVQLRRTEARVTLLVMWKFLEQQSFPLTEADYEIHLQAVILHLEAWGVLEHVTREIRETRQHPRLGKAVAIPLPLGARASEWLL